MAKCRLEYWDGDSWEEAKTIAYRGSGSEQNALMNFELEDNHNNPMVLKATLSNASVNPFDTSTPANQYGPLTGIFTNFMQVRLLDTETKVILFSGKIYDVDNLYDKGLGQVIKLRARDNLAELADYITDSKDGDINLGTTTGIGRSDVIKQIIRDTASDPDRNSLMISTDNIVTNDTQKFEESARDFIQDTNAKVLYSAGTAYQSTDTITGSGTTWTTSAHGGKVFEFDGGGGGGLITQRNSNTEIEVDTSATVHSSGSQGTYKIYDGSISSIFKISELDKHGLAAINAIAKNDPHEGHGAIKDYGYDYYADYQFPLGNTNSAHDFNYFKRGTRTPIGNAAGTTFDGLTIEYPTTAFDATG